MAGSQDLAVEAVEHILVSLKSRLPNMPLEVALNGIIPGNEEMICEQVRGLAWMRWPCSSPPPVGLRQQTGMVVRPAPTHLWSGSQKPLSMLASRAILVFLFVALGVRRLRASCNRTLGRVLPSPFSC
jgi:hypothetical protein